MAAPARTYHLVTLGCPKNQVDSDKLEGTLVGDGMQAVDDPSDADMVVVNTCAFIEEARTQSIDTILELSDRNPDAELVVTGCLAERSGDELASALPEIDRVAGFGVPVALSPRRPTTPSLDLLELARPASTRPWAYVKIAEGCDRACGFCAIPSFRGPQRSRSIDAIVAEVEALDVAEAVLVAQDLAAYGRDQGRGSRDLVPLVDALRGRVDWIRMLYLYPSDLDDRLVESVLSTGVPYFDLSLQHVSRPLLRAMRRWGDGDRFVQRIEAIRSVAPDAVFRSNFIVGYPGETEDDHDALLRFVEAVQLDWCGFFTYSREAGTHADTLDHHVPTTLMLERHAELTELQDGITAARRDQMVGRRVEVLVDEQGVARSRAEAPEIDGVIEVPTELAVGRFHTVDIVAALGPDLVATEVCS